MNFTFSILENIINLWFTGQIVSRIWNMYCYGVEVREYFRHNLESATKSSSDVDQDPGPPCASQLNSKFLSPLMEL